MTDQIRIKAAEGTWVVRAGGAVIGETTRAMELSEDGHAPVIYFPREDIAMAFLDMTDTETTCPWKGTASYFTIVTESGPIHDAAWSYADPIPGAEAIAGHLAFYPDKATVERV
ncbi:MAG: hypothetical protein B7Z02_10685 [Rhodobacterales bacterium 32-67-9]|nr:MAG: hypothetical protein B7Z02_10685 [Rhodobacterales bacterium 32-67-9]